jgi:predicted Fe-S protein YdhL (DUF1289 family)
MRFKHAEEWKLTSISNRKDSEMLVEACLKRMHEVMYWLCMAAEVKQHVLTCDTCTKHQRALGREPLKQHKVPDMLWVKVAVDLCQFNNRTLLMMINYHRNYIEVDSLTSSTTADVITMATAATDLHSII